MFPWKRLFPDKERVLYASVVRQGDREYSEDYVKCCQTDSGYCFVVADGLGGHGKGEIASQSVCESATDYCMNIGDDLAGLFEYAQSRLLKRQEEEDAQSSMKTTMNVLCVEERLIKIGHVGDTRTYYFKNRRMIFRTKDHSIPQMLVDRGMIQEEEIRNHPDRNRLLRAMGIVWETAQYVIEEDIKNVGRQAFLMCTDGFWEHISDAEMLQCLKKSKTPEAWLTEMLAIVEGAGSSHNMDNYSAIVVWVK